MRYSLFVILLAIFVLSCNGDKGDKPVLISSEIETPKAEASATSDTSMRNPNFDYSRYKPFTMKTLMDSLSILLKEEQTGIYVPGIDFSFTVDVVYTGLKRAMNPKKLEALNYAFSAVGSLKNAVNLYQNEVLFKEGSTEYWMPVQEALVPIMTHELKPGDKVSLYAIWFGAVYNESGIPDVFLLTNEFWKGPQGK